MIEHRSMTANMANFSSRMAVSLEKAITEAVVNSIQANATKIRIEFHKFNDGKIDYITIADNGIGFTEKNVNSFFDLHSDSKIAIGGKGVGRASWFKYFKAVDINSIFETPPSATSINFTFKISDRDVSLHKRFPFEGFKENLTTVKLLEYYGNNLPLLSAQNFKSYLLHEVVLTLFNRAKEGYFPTIEIISYEADGNYDKESITESDLPIVAGAYTFDLTFEGINKNFTLHCLKVDNRANNSVDTGFIAGGRTIPDFYSALGLKVHAPTGHHTGKYWLLLESDLLNKGRFSTEGRDRVTFPEGKNLYGEDIRAELKGTLIRIISAFYDKIIPDHKKQREETIREIIDLYPHYASQEYITHIKEFCLNTVGRISKHDLLTKLSGIEFNKDYTAKRTITLRLKEKNVAHATIKQTVSFAESTSVQAKSALSNYLWYRNAIIEQLKSYTISREQSEELLHELFMQRHTKQTEATLKNCLWLLDDKFMRFSYFASEAVVNGILQELYLDKDESFYAKKRMDLFVRFDRPNESPFVDCVVIEFKALGATVDERANASSQVRRKYAKVLRDRIPKLNNLFIYIVTEIDDELYENLISDDYRDEFSRHGRVLSYYNKNNDAYIIFVSATSIIGSAGDRHDIFFKILKEDYKSVDLWGDDTLTDEKGSDSD